MRGEALSVAERTGSLELALEAVGRADPGGGRDVIARLVRARADAGGSLAGLSLAEPLTRALDDAARLDFERLGADLPGEPLTPERLALLGVRALPRLHQLLRAAARHEDAARLAPLARAIRTIDRWDPLARAIGHLEDAHLLDLAIDLVGTAVPSGRGVAIARLVRTRRGDPDSAVLAVALAAYCLEAHLAGDALDHARQAIALAHDDEQRRTAELIAALALSVDGDGGPIADWELANDPEGRSIAIARALAPHRSIAGVGATLRARAHAAMRLLVGQGVGDRSLAFEVAVDGAVPDEERARALDALWVADRAGARIAAQCAAEHTDHEACEARLDLLGETAWWDGLVPTGPVSDLDETAIPELELAVHADDVAAASAWVDSAASSRLAIAPAWIRARIVLAARSGDVSGARARLLADGPLLTAATRVALATWLDDLAAGRTVALEDLSAALALGPAVIRFATPPIDEPHLEVTEIHSNTQRLVAADLHLSYDAWRADAVGCLRPLLDGASDRDGAVIAGWMGAAVDRDARERGTSASALTPISERARALAPDTAVELLLEALRLSREGDAAVARDALARVLVLAPTSRLLQMRWLAAWSEADAYAPADDAQSRLLAMDPIGLPRTVATGAATDVADLLGLYGVYLPARHAELVLRGGPRVARADGAWEAIESALTRWVALGPDAGGEAESAVAMLALVEAAAPSPERRRWLVRLRILLRDVDGAIAAADAPEPDDAGEQSDPPLAPDDRLRVIAQARGELFDPLAWGLIAEDELGDDPDTLERLRARARNRPELDALLCGELARMQGFAPVTMETCVRAWRRQPGPTAATALSRALVEALDAAEAHGLSPDAFFAEVHSALGTEVPGAALHQEALMLERRGRYSRAVDMEVEAQAHGWIPEAWGPRGPSLRRGLVVRAERARPVAPRWSELALLALGDARLVAARLYADAAVASMRGVPAGVRTDLAYAARDLVAWASSDLAASRIDADGVAAFERARVAGFADAETAPLIARHPESSLVAYAATVRAVRAGQPDEALRWADVALRDEARPTLVSVIAPITEEARGHGESEALRARARATSPDDPRIDQAPIDVVPLPARPRERALVATAGAEGCSLTRQLAAAESDTGRASLLQAAFRTAPDEAARRRVLACVEPRGVVAAAEPIPPAPTEAAAPTVARTAEAPPPPATHTATPTLAEWRRLAQEEELARIAAAQRRAEEADRLAIEGERRATEADARRTQAEARLAEAERRAAEAERRAAETRPSAAAAEPTAVLTSDAELRAADAERRVAEAERRAAEAEARAALAERTAIEEARRIAAASQPAEPVATPATPTAVEPVVTPPLPIVEPTVTLPLPIVEPVTPPLPVVEPVTPPLPLVEPTVPPPLPIVEPTVTPPVVVTEPPAPLAHPDPLPAADAGVPSTVATAPADAPPTGVDAAPAPPTIRMLAQLPSQTPAEAAAQAQTLAAEADQRVAMSESRLALAAARVGDAEALAADAGSRASHAEALVLEGERRVLEAEARAAEAELRAAEASHLLEATLQEPTATPDLALAPSASPAIAVASETAPAHAGGLGLTAVLDEDPESHRRGLALALNDPEGALIAAREIVQAPSRAAPPEGAALPPFGTVQALVGLPHAARRTLAAEMMNGSDRERRLLALAAERVQPGTVDVDALRRTIETDDPGLAIEAVRAHELRAGAVELDAMRTRLDAMSAPLAAPERELARAIVHALAGAIDARDRARLAGASELVRSGLADDQRASGAVAAQAIEHDAAVYLAARARGAPRDPSLAPEVERIRRAHQPNLPSAAAVRLLATEPLSRVLTGSSWRYARLAQPSQFVTAITGGATEPAIARAAITWLDEHGGSQLGAEGGLDLDRPIECAQADSGPRSWVCIAHVRDPDRVRASLARRPLGGHSGPWLALGVAELARGLPVFAGPTPLAIDRILQDEASGPTESDRGALTFAERARADVDLGGVVVERYATLERRGDRATDVDTELYLFTGDRLVVFGDEEMARTIVGRPPTPGRSLARSARFRRVTGGWSDGAALETAALDWRGGGEMPIVMRRDASIVMTAEAGGIVVTMRAPFTDPRGDARPLAALLPEDVVAFFSLGANAPRPPRARRGAAAPLRALEGRADVARLLLREAERIAFAWLPRSGDALWDHWVAISEGPRIDAALAAAGVAAPSEGELANLAGTFVARRGSRWVIAPVEEDVRAALARPDVPADPRAAAIGAGHLDGARGSRAILGLAGGLPVGDPHRATLDALGARLAGTGELSFEAHVESRQLVLTTRVGSSPR